MIVIVYVQFNLEFMNNMKYIVSHHLMYYSSTFTYIPSRT